MAIRSQLRTRARDRADQGTAFPTDTQFNTYIDQATADVWRRLVAAGWKPGRITVSITANGSASYNIGTDVHVVTEVARVEGALYTVLQRVKDESLTELRSIIGSPAFAYDLTGGATTAVAIELLPRPSTGSYEVRYIPRFAGFTADSDNWYGPDGSDELIVLGAAIRGLEQEDGNTDALMRDMKFRWQEIIEQASWLDTRNPPTVRDVYGTRRYIRDGADWNIPGTDAWF